GPCGLPAPRCRASLAVAQAGKSGWCVMGLITVTMPADDSAQVRGYAAVVSHHQSQPHSTHDPTSSRLRPGLADAPVGSLGHTLLLLLSCVRTRPSCAAAAPRMIGQAGEPRWGRTKRG